MFHAVDVFLSENLSSCSVPWYLLGSPPLPLTISPLHFSLDSLSLPLAIYVLMILGTVLFYTLCWRTHQCPQLQAIPFIIA